MAVADNRLRGRAAAVYGLWAVLALGSLGCAPEELELVQTPARQQAGVMESNRLLPNRLLPNRLLPNRLLPNRLLPNGLTSISLEDAEFHAWFAEDVEASADLMEYVVSCAVPAGGELTYTHPTTGAVYHWQGALGLAADWAAGREATLLEKQLVSACLGARTNKFGLRVVVSILGLGVQGQPLPTEPEEASYTVAEGAFFGNLLEGEPVWACNSGLSLAANQSTPRVCALPGGDGGSQCLPMEYLGDCQQHCTLDETGRYYVDCYYNGTHYRPLTTWLHPQDVPTCGDGVLHDFEQPGMPGECGADQP